MSIKELESYTFVSKYARWIPEKKRRETWKESVDRVKEMEERKAYLEEARSQDAAE